MLTKIRAVTTRNPIHHATTADGLTIPFTISGSGYPLLHLPNFGLLDPGPKEQLVHQAIEERFQRIAFDGRGTGLAPRGLISYTIADRIADLEAVVAASGVSRFVLHGHAWQCATAIRFAVEHPGTVAALWLVNPFPPGPGFGPMPLTEVRPDAWQHLLRSLAAASLPATSLEMQNITENLARRVAHADYVVMARGLASDDVTAFMARVTVPVLVIGVEGLGLEPAARVAAASPTPSARPSNCGRNWSGSTSRSSSRWSDCGRTRSAARRSCRSSSTKPAGSCCVPRGAKPRRRSPTSMPGGRICSSGCEKTATSPAPRSSRA